MVNCMKLKNKNVRLNLRNSVSKKSKIPQYDSIIDNPNLMKK
jgi:hypothetical protein